MREGNNYEIYNFVSDIIDEVAPDKALDVSEKAKHKTEPGRQFMISLITKDSNNHMLSSKRVYIEIQTTVQCF